jgi:hypothetical protein
MLTYRYTYTYTYTHIQVPDTGSAEYAEHRIRDLDHVTRDLEQYVRRMPHAQQQAAAGAATNETTGWYVCVCVCVFVCVCVSHQ